jgi:hypothetical protein
MSSCFSNHSTPLHTSHRSRSATLLGCIADPEALMSVEQQAQCLPPDLRGDRRTLKLIKVYIEQHSLTDKRLFLGTQTIS